MVDGCGGLKCLVRCGLVVDAPRLLGALQSMMASHNEFGGASALTNPKYLGPAIEESERGLDKAREVHYLHKDNTPFPFPVPFPVQFPVPSP